MRKPKGAFQGLMGRGTEGIPDITKEGGEEPEKKKKNPTHKHTQTFYNSVFIGA